jgi:RNA polymerase sigma factor (sigma-70 family)
MKKVLEFLGRLVPIGDDNTTDAHLLGRFVAARDETAFAALFRRHGPMVLGVCRRMLINDADAEDAFQAAFFVLARRAASVVKRASLACWLYGVAYRTALEARARRWRRRARETPMEEMPHPHVDAAEVQDWRPLLDEELGRLPEKYRTAVILADLEGRTRKQVAGLLRVPEGTVSSRLATARRMLAERLTRRGVALSGGAVAAALTAERATAGVSVALALSTVKDAVQFAAGHAAALASPAAVLTMGVFKAMLMTKLKVIVATVMVATVLGACGLAYYTSAAQAAPNAERKDDLEALRKENDLLRRSLEVALDRIKAQDAELKNLHDREKKRDVTSYESLSGDYYRALDKKNKYEKAVDQLDAWMNALRDAKDKVTTLRAVADLEKALQRLKESLKPEEKEGAKPK